MLFIFIYLRVKFCMTETILITGASGFLGKRIVRFLQRMSSAYVMTTSRKQESFPNHLVRDLANVTSELTNQVDTVIHFAGLNAHSQATETEFHISNVENTINVAKTAIQSGVKRFIFISTVDVYALPSQSHEVITENSRLKPQTPYAQSKLMAENELKKLCENGAMNLIILRLPLIYHIDVLNHFGQYINMIKQERALPFDKINNGKNLLALCNFESALYAVLCRPQIVNETIIIADDISLSTTEIMNGIAVAAIVPIKLFYIPPLAAKIILTLTGKQHDYADFWGNFRVSSKYAQKQLDWIPSDNFILNLSK